MKFIIGSDTVATFKNFDFFVAGEVEKIADEGVLEAFKNADYRIINLETPLSDRGAPIVKSGPCIIAPLKAVNGIKKFDPSLVLLANNHTLDHGEESLIDTVNILDEYNIEWIGAGDCLKSAAAPYIFEKDNIKVGIYNCCEHEFTIAGENSWGANPYDPLESFDHIAELKKKCDRVIVCYHGGKENYHYPTPWVQKSCRKMIEKGADVVICQHSHCIGCFEDYMGGKIIYGQGNFIFSTNSRRKGWIYGMLVEITIGEEMEFNYLPICSSDTGVRSVVGEEAKEILAELYERSEQIKDPEFVKSNYLKFADELLNKYMQILSGNKEGENVIENYSTEDIAFIFNCVNCEAHQEILHTALKDKLR